MSGGIFGFDANQYEKLCEGAQAYGDGAEDVVNQVLHTKAGPVIYRSINPLINPSGRTFRGHRASARTSDWPRYDADENLAITVGTKRKYHYLYFPDDGSNTKNHAGDQRFFERGGLAASDPVVDMCLDALESEWKE